MVTCIIQARMSSTRLEGKVLKEICGYPMICLELERLKKSKYIDKVVVATTVLKEDDVLYETLTQKGYDVYRGCSENVLKRYVDCVNEIGGDTIVRIIGDCPAIDPIIVDNVITNFNMYDYDYVKLDVPQTFIRGFDVEVFSKEALLRTFSLASEVKHKEDVTNYIYDNKDKFLVGEVKGTELYEKNYRLCVDEAEDFALVSNIFNHFDDIYVSSKEIVNYLDENSEVAVMNAKIMQKEA